jgi:hypothetical protein
MPGLDCEKGFSDQMDLSPDEPERRDLENGSFLRTAALFGGSIEVAIGALNQIGIRARAIRFALERVYQRLLTSQRDFEYSAIADDPAVSQAPKIAIEEAINRGYKNADGLMADDDLKNLRPNPKFQQLVAELKHPPAKDQKAQTQ